MFYVDGFFDFIKIKIMLGKKNKIMYIAIRIKPNAGSELTIMC